MARSDPRRVAILGAGPVGLEAALYARTLGFPVTIYDRGQVGDAMRRWGHIRLFSPFGMNITPRGRAVLGKATLPADTDCITGQEHVTAYLEPLSKCDLLRGCLEAETTVVSVGRGSLLKSDVDPRRGQTPFRLLVSHLNKERIEEADIVLDCTGTYMQHRWCGEGGIPAPGERFAEPQMAYYPEDVLGSRRQHYAGKSILLVGGGYSAATMACHLATLSQSAQETWTVWLARSPKTQPMPRIANDVLKERDRLAVKANNLASRGEGNIEYHPSSDVQAVEWRGADRGFHVTARCSGKSRTWDVDRVIAMVGYSPDNTLYRELQIDECPLSLAPKKMAALLDHLSDERISPTFTAASLTHPEPNFYILGAKSYGRHSQFLMKSGFDQIRVLFAALMGNPELNLYHSAT